MTRPASDPSPIQRVEFEHIGAYELNYYGPNGESLNLPSVQPTDQALSIIIEEGALLVNDHIYSAAPPTLAEGEQQRPAMKVAAANYVHWHHWLGKKVLDVDGLAELVAVTHHQKTISYLVKWLTSMAYIDRGGPSLALSRRTFHLNPIATYIDRRNPPPTDITPLTKAWAENGWRWPPRPQPQQAPVPTPPVSTSDPTPRSPKRPNPAHTPTTPPAKQRAVPPDRSWQDYANCLGVDPDLFFPERGASTREAKEVCRACVVRDDCLEYALGNDEKFGIWGGMSERERRRIRRQRALAGAAANAAD